MPEIFNSVQAKVRDGIPLAVWVHCFSHSLSLVIFNACHIKDIRIAWEKMVKHFRRWYSPLSCLMRI
ncbi:hypothetical protein X975_15447, partial [Stegodyphus mimosarum]